MDETALLTAGEIRAAKSLSAADSWILATGIVHRAVLVHKDPEFAQGKDPIPLLLLPYKV
jgi:predicted nucleic acid-binding protein